MKIWWINYTALPPDEAGGTRHYSFARELISRGHDVTVVAASFHYVSEEPIRLEEDEAWRLQTEAGVPFVWLRAPSYRGEQTVRRLASWLEFSRKVWSARWTSNIEPPDIVIGSSPYPFAALAAERIASRYEVPFIYEVRDLWPETLIELGDVSPWHPFVFVLRAIEAWLCRRASGVVSLLRDASGYLSDRGAEKDSIVWIPNGVDLEMLPAIREVPDEEPFVLLYAGAHTLANDLDLLLDAAARVGPTVGNRRLEVRLVGDGREKSRLVSRARREGLNHVSFFPPVPKTEIYQVLAEAHAFYMAFRDSPLYRWGASPNKLFDYLASARPVIYAVPGTRNPVERAGAGVTVQPGHLNDLVEAIRTLASRSAKELTQFGRRGREHVEESYSVATLADELEGFLRHQLQGRRAAGSVTRGSGMTGPE